MASVLHIYRPMWSTISLHVVPLVRVHHLLFVGGVGGVRVGRVGVVCGGVEGG